MHTNGSNDLDDPEEFADLMDLDLSSDTSETDSESDSEPKTPTKKQGGTAAAAAATVSFHHPDCHFNKTHHYIQTNTRSKKKAQSKL